MSALVQTPLTLRTAVSRVGLAGAVTIARLTGTIALFAMLARVAGPSSFASFTYWYALSVMAAAMTEYGFSQHVLSALPASTDPAERQRLVDQTFRAKYGLTLLAATITAAIAWMACESPHERAIALLLIAAAMAGSVTDLLSMLLRAVGAFRADAWTATLVGLGASILSGVTALVTDDLLAAAVVLLAVRLAGAVIQRVAIVAASRLHVPWRGSLASVAGAWQGLRGSWRNGVDNLSIQLMLNFEVFACRLFLDPIQAGLYLSANRLSNAANAGFPVLMSVFLPSIAAASVRGVKGKDRAKTMLALAGIGFGLFWNALMWTLSDRIAVQLFGEAFAAAAPLLGPLAVAIGLRYASLLPCVQLIVAGHLYGKAATGFIAVALAAALLWWQYRSGVAVQAQHLILSVNLANAVQTVGLIALAAYLGRSRHAV